jgi:prepilin peptidase CpaA
MLPGHILGATGAGDVKFMAAVGAIMGPALVVSAFLFTALAGGVLAVAVAIRRKRLAATLAGTGRLIAAPAEAKKEIQSATVSSRFAYGPAIAIGSVLAALLG